MTINNTAVALIAPILMAIGLILNAIVHWEKIRPVLFSSAVFSFVELLLLFGCYFGGRFAIIAGANLYLLLVFVDFIRKGRSDCGSIATMVYTAAVGSFNFALQMALAINGK